jgi:hypothetical protein
MSGTDADTQLVARELSRLAAIAAKGGPRSHRAAQRRILFTAAPVDAAARFLREAMAAALTGGQQSYPDWFLWHQLIYITNRHREANGLGPLPPLNILGSFDD